MVSIVSIQILGMLTAERCRVSLSSKMSEPQQAKLDRVEPWFGTKFRRTPFAADKLALWSDCSRSDPAFHLPKPNEFVPTNFDLVQHPALPELPSAGTPEASLPWKYPAPTKVSVFP
jgi:secreted Zn-dependent insulinase-like peptidase